MVRKRDLVRVIAPVALLVAASLTLAACGFSAEKDREHLEEIQRGTGLVVSPVASPAASPAATPRATPGATPGASPVASPTR